MFLHITYSVQYHVAFIIFLHFRNEYSKSVSLKVNRDSIFNDAMHVLNRYSGSTLRDCDLAVTFINEPGHYNYNYILYCTCLFYNVITTLSLRNVKSMSNPRLYVIDQLYMRQFKIQLLFEDDTCNLTLPS